MVRGAVAPKCRHTTPREHGGRFHAREPYPRGVETLLTYAPAMNWRALLDWGAVVAGGIIVLLMAIDGEWLLMGVCIALGAGVLLFEVQRAKRRGEFR